MKKQKILFVINTLSRAGAEIALLERLYRMNPREYDIDIYVMTGMGELRRKLPHHVRLINESFNDISVHSPLGRLLLAKKVLNAILKSPIGALKHARCIRLGDYKDFCWHILADTSDEINTKYDIAAAFIEGASTYFTADKTNAKRKEAYLHIDYLKGGYSPQTDGGVYNKFDAIYTVSASAKVTLLRFYPKLASRTHTLPNTITLERIKRLAKKGEGFDDYYGVRLLSVGRLFSQKNYELALRTAHVLKERGFVFKWYIIGDGPLKLKLRLLIKRFGLNENVRLLGRMSNPYPYMNTCDIFVNTSRYEGRSVAIEEALLLEKDVVATDVAGNHEQLMYEDYALLVEEDEHILADAIEYMMMEMDEEGNY